MEVRVKVVNIGRKHLVLRWVEPETGLVRQKSAKTSSRRQAERAAAKLEADLQAGRPVSVFRTTWEEFRERFEAEKLSGLATQSAATYQSSLNILERLMRPYLLKDITAGRVSTFQAKLRSEGLRESSIASYSRHLKAALNWAVEIGLLVVAPRISMPKRAKGSKMMKGRPITARECVLMLKAVESVVGQKAAPSWRYYLKGMWWSGLRLSESLQLYWDRADRLCVDLTGKRPMLRISAEFEKGHQNRLHPITPEFAMLLSKTPKDKRSGAVFDPLGYRGTRPRADWVSKVVAAIGKKAGVVVNVHAHGQKIKYSTVHDLRRSFGERWAGRLLPQQLKELMRHESIETTLRYYVGSDAARAAEQIWRAYEQS